jgi:hypothetical protein
MREAAAMALYSFLSENEEGELRIDLSLNSAKINWSWPFNAKQQNSGEI